MQILEYAANVKNNILHMKTFTVTSIGFYKVTLKLIISEYQLLLK